MIATTNFFPFFKIFLSPPGIEPATYLFVNRWPNHWTIYTESPGSDKNIKKGRKVSCGAVRGEGSALEITVATGNEAREPKTYLLFVVGQTIGLLSHHILGSLASFLVATVKSGNLPSPHALQYTISQ